MNNKSVPAATVVLAILALAGCSSPTTATAPVPQCAAPPEVPAGTAVVAVLAQMGAVGYERNHEAVIEGASQLGAHLIVNAVGQDLTASNLVVNLMMTADGDNPLQRKSNLDCKKDAVRDGLAGIAAVAPTEALDVFGALMTLDGNLGSDTGTVDVVFFSSVMNTVAPVTLTDPAHLADPVGTLNVLASNMLIPDCSNWRAHAIGSAPGADAILDQQLREFWRQYFERCGGRLVEWSASIGDFPGGGEALEAPDTALIEVTEKDGSYFATLGGDVLFDTRSAELRSGAEEQLSQLLALAEDSSGEITIYGHTDATGDPEFNLVLSGQRADTVAAWLIERGVPESRITTHGLGSSSPVYANPQDEAQLQANRRVTVEIGS